MKKVIGYIVKKGGEIIAATGNEREAMHIAREYKSVSYKVTTTINPNEEPTTDHTVAYDGTI